MVTKRLITPQQQCLLLFFLDLNSPSTKLLPKSFLSLFHHRFNYDGIRWLVSLGYRLALKTKRPIRDITTELESRLNMEPSDILSQSESKHVLHFGTIEYVHMLTIPAGNMK